MPSNKDLSKEIAELCGKLGYTQIDTKDMDNEALAATVSDLKGQLKDKENQTPADDAKAEAEAKAKAEEEAKAKAEEEAANAKEGDETPPEKTEDGKPPTDGDTSNSVEGGKPKVKEPEFVVPDFEYYVKEGKCLTTKRGIKTEGAEITEKDLVGGIKTIKTLIKKGYIGKA